MPTELPVLEQRVGLDTDPFQSAIDDLISEIRQFGKEMNQASKEMSREFGNMVSEVKGVSNDFKREFDKSAKEAKKASRQMSKDFKKSFKDIKDDLGTLTTSFAAIFAGLTAAIVIPSKSFADFQSTLKRVEAVSGATRQEIESFKQTALEYGKATQFSNQAVADAGLALTKMGFSAQGAEQAMEGVVLAAQASGEELPKTADLVATTLRGFQIEASESARVADILAQATNKSALNLSKLQFSLKFIAPVAASSNQSLEDMVGILAALANAGIRGEQAGTAIRAMLVRLQDPPREAAEAIEKLGLVLTDAQGKMRSLPDIIADLQKKTSGLTESTRNMALSQIFGTEALSATAALMNTSKEELAALIAEMENAEGASKRAADILQTGLAFSFEQLAGSIETALSSFGESFEEPLTMIMDGLRAIVDRMESIPKPVKDAIAIFTIMGAGLAGLATVIGVTVLAVGSFAAAWGAASPVLTAVPGVLGSIAAALGPLIAPIVATIATLQAFKFAWETNLGGVRDILQPLIDSISIFFGDFRGEMDETQMFIATAMQGIKDTFSTAVGFIDAALRGLFGFIDKVFRAIADVSVGNWRGAWEAIAEIVSGGSKLVSDLTGQMFERLAAMFKQGFRGLSEIAAGAWDAISNPTAPQGGLDRMAAGFDTVTSAASKMGGVVQDSFNNVFDNILASNRVMRSEGEKLLSINDKQTDKLIENQKKLQKSREKLSPFAIDRGLEDSLRSGGSGDKANKALDIALKQASVISPEQIESVKSREKATASLDDLRNKIGETAQDFVDSGEALRFASEPTTRKISKLGGSCALTTVKMLNLSGTTVDLTKVIKNANWVPDFLSLVDKGFAKQVSRQDVQAGDIVIRADRGHIGIATSGSEAIDASSAAGRRTGTRQLAVERPISSGFQESSKGQATILRLTGKAFKETFRTISDSTAKSLIELQRLQKVQADFAGVLARDPKKAADLEKKIQDLRLKIKKDFAKRAEEIEKEQEKRRKKREEERQKLIEQVNNEILQIERSLQSQLAEIDEKGLEHKLNLIEREKKAIEQRGVDELLAEQRRIAQLNKLSLDLLKGVKQQADALEDAQKSRGKTSEQQAHEENIQGLEKLLDMEQQVFTSELSRTEVGQRLLEQINRAIELRQQEDVHLHEQLIIQQQREKLESRLLDISEEENQISRDLKNEEIGRFEAVDRQMELIDRRIEAKREEIRLAMMEGASTNELKKLLMDLNDLQDSFNGKLKDTFQSTIKNIDVQEQSGQISMLDAAKQRLSTINDELQGQAKHGGVSLELLEKRNQLLVQVGAMEGKIGQEQLTQLGISKEMAGVVVGIAENFGDILDIIPGISQETKGAIDDLSGLGQGIARIVASGGADISAIIQTAVAGIKIIADPIKDIFFPDVEGMREKNRQIEEDIRDTVANIRQMRFESGDIGLDQFTEDSVRSEEERLDLELKRIDKERKNAREKAGFEIGSKGLALFDPNVREESTRQLANIDEKFRSKEEEAIAASEKRKTEIREKAEQEAIRIANDRKDRELAIEELIAGQTKSKVDDLAAQEKERLEALDRQFQEIDQQLRDDPQATQSDIQKAFTLNELRKTAIKKEFAEKRKEIARQEAREILSLQLESAKRQLENQKGSLQARLNVAKLESKEVIDRINEQLDKEEEGTEKFELLQEKKRAAVAQGQRAQRDIIIQFSREAAALEREAAIAAADITETKLDDIQADYSNTIATINKNLDDQLDKYEGNERAKAAATEIANNKIIKAEIEMRKRLERIRDQELDDLRNDKMEELRVVKDITAEKMESEISPLNDIIDREEDRLREIRNQNSELEEQLRLIDERKQKELDEFEELDKIEFDKLVSGVDIEPELRAGLEEIANPERVPTDRFSQDSQGKAIEEQLDLLSLENQNRFRLEEVTREQFLQEEERIALIRAKFSRDLASKIAKDEDATRRDRLEAQEKVADSFQRFKEIRIELINLERENEKNAIEESIEDNRDQERAVSNNIDTQKRKIEEVKIKYDNDFNLIQQKIDQVTGKHDLWLKTTNKLKEGLDVTLDGIIAKYNEAKDAIQSAFADANSSIETSSQLASGTFESTQNKAIVEDSGDSTTFIMADDSGTELGRVDSFADMGGTFNVPVFTSSGKLRFIQEPDKPMFDVIKTLPGFRAGGIIPEGFPDDSFVARLSSGETVLPKWATDLLSQAHEVTKRPDVFNNNKTIQINITGNQFAQGIDVEKTVSDGIKRAMREAQLEGLDKSGVYYGSLN